jgi:hypothetical protein
VPPDFGGAVAVDHEIRMLVAERLENLTVSNR